MNWGNVDYSAEFGTKEEIRCQEGFVDLASALYVSITPCPHSRDSNVSITELSFSKRF